MTEQRTRRDALRTLGTGAVGGLALLAGCSSGGGDGTDTATGAGGSTSTSPGSGTTVGTTSTGPTEITDMTGRTVEVPTPAESVLGIGSGGLRMVSYLGASDRVVAVEQVEQKTDRPPRPYLLANPEYRDLPSIGSRKSPDIERILKEDPDVVVYGWAKQKKAESLQSKLGIPVVAVRPGDINDALRPDFYETLRLVGQILGESERAEALVSATDEYIADLDSRTSDAGPSPRAYVGYLGRGKHGFTYTQPLYPPFDFTNATNVAGDVTEDLKAKKGAARVTLDPEQVIKWDPEYVFIDLGTETYDALSAPEYQDITAIENGDVYGVFPTRDYSINFGTALADAYYVGSVLYPDAFSDVDPVAKADSIWQTYVGAGVYDGAVEAYGGGFAKMDVN